MVAIVDEIDPKTSFKIARKAAEIIKHRGPDSEGFYQDGRVSLIHTRLAILDTSTRANQPMSNRKDQVLIFNGFLSNYESLKSELITEGIEFETTSDTEVLLKVWEKYGIKCIPMLEGMFSFILYSPRDNQMTLVRDRYGIKPLYFWQNRNSLRIIISSEVGAILELMDQHREINLETMYEYFSFQNNLNGGTLYKGIEEINPGTYRVIETKDKKFKDFTYWDFDFNTKDKIDHEEAKNEITNLLKKSVHKNLAADQKIGSYLSSGIDSGLISSFASLQNFNFSTFTVGFKVNDITGYEKLWDESESAHRIAKKIGSKNYKFIVDSRLMEKGIEKVLNILDDPKMGQSYPNYFAAQLARKEVKVVLSGTGGDEIFCGYPWRYLPDLPLRNQSETYFKSWQRICDEEQLHSLFKNTKKELLEYPRENFDKIWTSAEKIHGDDFLANQLYFEAKTFLRGLLNIEDKISMHFGLETRYPYLDNQLVDFATGIDKSYYLKRFNYLERYDINSLEEKEMIAGRYNNNGKVLLREISKDFLPDNFSISAKKGFSAPDATWFREHSSNYITDFFSNKKDVLYEYVFFEEVQKIITTHFEGKKNNRLLIWNLLSFSSLLNKWIK